MGYSTSQDHLLRLTSEFFHSEVTAIEYMSLTIPNTSFDAATAVGGNFLFMEITVEADPATAAGAVVARYRFDNTDVTPAAGAPLYAGEKRFVRRQENLGLRLISVNAAMTHTLHIHVYRIAES